MLQGSQDLLVLSHVEQFDGVHRALVGGRSDAVCPKIVDREPDLRLAA
jgi:hypothetical protein